MVAPTRSSKKGLTVGEQVPPKNIQYVLHLSISLHFAPVYHSFANNSEQCEFCFAAVLL